MQGSSMNLLNSDNYLTEIVNLLKTNSQEFPKKFNDYCRTESITEFFEQISREQKLKVADVCHEKKMFVIHKLISLCIEPTQIQFLKSEEYKHDFYRKNLELKSWLQIAVLNNRDIRIVKFLVETLKIDPNDTDIYGYSVLHSLCQKENFVKDEFVFLLEKMKSNPDEPNLFMIKAEDGITPLELACGDEKKLNFIKKHKNTSAIQLLIDIDNVAAGLVDPEVTYVELSRERIWLTILLNNDKPRLTKYIKLTLFSVSYYLDPEKIEPIIRKLPDNGLGILRHIKKHYVSSDYQSDAKLPHYIFEKLTQIKIVDPNIETNFANSLLFVALITGRYQLVPLLLRSCQFEILPYSMMICYLCKILSNVKDFSEQVKASLKKTKDFCENFAIDTLNRTENKEAKNQKQIMINYLLADMNSLEGQSVIDVAYKADCRHFLNLRICQNTLDQMWYGRFESVLDSVDMKSALKRIKLTIVSPYFKFVLHTVAHVIFLLLFSYSLINPYRRLFYPSLIYCCIYAFGYLVEESRQFYHSYKVNGVLAYICDESNILDMSALLFMIVAVVAMVFTNIVDNYAQSDSTFWVIFLYSISLTLFFMRLLYLAYAFETFGPKLKMIGKMILKDLLPLLCIFLIFIVSFGIMFQSLILFANRVFLQQKYRGDLSSIFGSIVRRPTFTIFNAHYIIEEIENVFKNRNSEIGVLYVLLVLFSTVVNILLINLLIALFSQTVNEIALDSKLSWRSKRYKIIMEYYERSYIPAPFNVVMIPLELVLLVVSCTTIHVISKRLQPHEIIRDEDCPDNSYSDSVNKVDLKGLSSRFRQRLSTKVFQNCCNTSFSKSRKNVPSRKISYPSFKTKAYDVGESVFNSQVIRLLSDNIFRHFSFCVLQAFGMRDCRHVMVTTEEERQGLRDAEFSQLGDRMARIEHKILEICTLLGSR